MYNLCISSKRLWKQICCIYTNFFTNIFLGNEIFENRLLFEFLETMFKFYKITNISPKVSQNSVYCCFSDIISQFLVFLGCLPSDVMLMIAFIATLDKTLYDQPIKLQYVTCVPKFPTSTVSCSLLVSSLTTKITLFLPYRKFLRKFFFL